MRVPSRIPCLSSWLLATASLAAAAATAPAGAQALTVRLHCINHGSNVVEPMGEGEGQSLLAAEATCSVHGGPMDGAVETQHNIWHYVNAKGTLLSGQSVARKPGGVSAAQVVDGELTLRSADGRVSGWSAAGRARIMIAAGSASALAGRTMKWTATPTGPRTYTVQLSYEP